MPGYLYRPGVYGNGCDLKRGYHKVTSFTIP